MDVPHLCWLDPRLGLARSPIHGLGLFATSAISSGDVVMILGGEVVPDADVRDLIARGERYDGIVLDDDANPRLLPADWPGIHGNHSCDPNLWLIAPVRIVVRRDIAPGEEACSDYSTYSMAPDWRMTCSCHSALCRGAVSGEDWRLADLQRRYEGHFAKPIERRIAARA
jgi:uncharacterized protein